MERFGAVAVVALMLGLAAAAPVHATTATDLCGAAVDPCVWSGNILVGVGSTLDFGARSLVIASGGIIRIDAGDTLTIKARRVTLQPGIGGRIRTNSTAGAPATVSIEASEDIVLQRSGTSRGRIDLRSDVTGGEIRLMAAGNVDMGGELIAHGTSVDADGGTVMIAALGNIVLNGNIDVSAGLDGLGGLVVADARGTLVAGSLAPEPLIDGRGGLEGGEVDLAAGPLLDVGARVNVNGTGAGTDGGFVAYTAAGDVTVRSEMSADGSGSIDFGGTGGDVALTAGGDIALNAALSFTAGFPDGEGGTLDAFAGVDIVQGAQIFGDGVPTQTYGGTILLDAGRTLMLGALVDISGGDTGGGGYFQAHAGEDVQALAEVNANGEGGYILLSTLRMIGPTPVVTGSVLVGGTLHANAPPAALGGAVSMQGCDVTVSALGTVQSIGGNDAENLVQGSGQITVAGKLTASAAPAGRNTIQYGDATKVPNLTGSVIAPVPMVTPVPGLPPCQMIPSPVCGNDALEVGEACDDGNTTPCDGCSADCRLETCGDGHKECTEACDDGNLVSGDGCDANCTPSACGNGVTVPPETCDDGNTAACDGCSGVCHTEACFSCSGVPSACSPIPGCGTTTTTSTAPPTTTSTSTTTTSTTTTTTSTTTTVPVTTSTTTTSSTTTSTSTTTTTAPTTTTTTTETTTSTTETTTTTTETTTTTTETTTSTTETTTSTTTTSTTTSTTTTTLGTTTTTATSSTSTSVTATSTSTSTTSTTRPLERPGTCPAGCDDGDPCTTDACVDGVCRSSEVTGARHATCVCDRSPNPACAGQALSSRFTKKVEKACGALRRVTGPSSAAFKRTRSALKSWKAATRLLGKRGVVRDLSPACVESLKASTADALGRTKAFLQQR